MLDTISLDQLRMLVAVFDHGNFSAAARRLGRVQSAVSHAMANLERDCGFEIWDRSTRIPTPTPNGLAMAEAARRVIAEADRFRRLAGGLRQGAEPSVSLCFDQFFPLQVIVDLGRDFAAAFPDVSLRFESETMSVVHARVRSGACHLGVAVVEDLGSDLIGRHIGSVDLIPVAAPGHPLARMQADGTPLERDSVERCVQVVLSERHEVGVPDRGVLGIQTWRVMDLHTKLEMIRAGLGWGNMPRHMVAADIADGRLVLLQPEGWPSGGVRLEFGLVQRRDLAPGPAMAWLATHFGKLCTSGDTLRQEH
jgi:DNA-binding transcriptional LysR family regulator